MIFRGKIRQELKTLNVEQQVAFAWRCAIRTLPLLGSMGHFDFWKKEIQQDYLLRIFYALDLIGYTSSLAVTAADIAGAAAVAAADVIIDAEAYADSYVGAAADEQAYAAAYASASIAFEAAAYAAAAIADAAYAVDAAVDGAAEFIADTDAVASYARSAAWNSSRAAKSSGIELESIILQDLKDINNKKSAQISIDNYGKVWEQFQSALKKESCGYWARWYKKIFDNNFNFNSTELERRFQVPKEIRKLGAAAVGKYLQELEKGIENLNESRIIILGEKGAGKTCVARKLLDPDAEMTKPEESTAGVDTHVWDLPNDKMKVRVWDFAGHVVTHAVHQFFLSERCLYIVIYDGRTELRNRLEYWLDHMKNYGGNSQAIILVNEWDDHAIKIPINYFKEKYPIVGFYSFNVKEDKRQLINFRNDVADYMKNNPSWKNKVIPKSYYLVKEKLEKLFKSNEENKGKEHIKMEIFMAIAESYEVKDPISLLKDLHALGISLWYNKMEEYETLILNPEWISQGVYQIINWVSNEKKYDLSLASFIKVFAENAKRFPKDKHRFLFNLIKHYELAYEARNGRLIIPHLLQEDQPENLPIFTLSDGLMMKFKADQPLPPNTIPRFIVRHNEQIKKEGNKYLVWKYGVILEDGNGSLALVRERERERTIEISVKGNKKTDYISELRTTLNNIFETYKSQHPTLRYRVVGDEIVERQDLWLPEQEIVTLEARNKPYYDYRTDRDIPMRPTIVNYNITKYYVNIRDTESVLLGGANQLNKNVFNFHNCNVGLQANLTELAQRLTKKGNTEDAEEFTEAIEILEEIKEGASKDEIKKKGILNRLKRIVKDLGDEGSTLHKSVEGIKHGISIAQDIAEEYNKIAQWCGLPQMPKPFLKK